MKQFKPFSLIIEFLLIVLARLRQEPVSAYPLLNHDTHFCVLSIKYKLNTSSTQHWTGKDHSLEGILKVDDKFYCLQSKSESISNIRLSAKYNKPYQAKSGFVPDMAT